MFYYSLYTSQWGMQNFKTPIITIVLCLIVMNYGLRCYYHEDSGNSILILLFCLSLGLYWRCLSVDYVETDLKTNSRTIHLKGSLLTYLMILINVGKLVVEVMLSQNTQQPNRFEALIKVRAKSMGMIILLNLYEIILLLTLVYIQKAYMVKVLDTELNTFSRNARKVSNVLKLLLFLMLFLEAFLGNPVYIVFIYMLMRVHMVASSKNDKVKYGWLFSKLRYFVVFMFLLRDIVQVYFNSTEAKPFADAFLQAFLDEKFFRKTLLFMVCHSYMYFKDLKQLGKKFIATEGEEEIIQANEFFTSYFKTVLLDNLLTIVDIKQYDKNATYFSTRLSKTKKYFEKCKLMDGYLLDLNKYKLEDGYLKLSKVVKKVIKMLLSMILINFEVIFKFITYILVIRICATNFNIHTFELFDLCMLGWCFLSFILPPSKTSTLKIYAINVVFPAFFIGLILTKFLKAIIKIPEFGNLLRYKEENDDKIDAYFTKHLYVFIPLILYTSFLIMKESKVVRENQFFVKAMMSDSKPGENMWYLTMLVKMVIHQVVLLSRYISLGFGIFASLVTINIPNTILLALTLFFFWTAGFDRVVWKLYLYYLIFLIMIIYVNDLLPQEFESFNHEFLTIFGFAQLPVIYDFQIMILFSTVFFASIYHRFIGDYDKKSIQKSLNEDSSHVGIFDLGKKIAKKLKHFFTHYMVWIFHMRMSLEKGDFFNQLLFCIDSIVFIVHLYLYWNYPFAERTKPMKKWTYPTFITVLILICSRYISFYTRYLLTRNVLFGFFSSFGLTTAANADQLFNENSIFSKLFLKTENTSKIDLLYSEFYLELIYLAMSSLALVSMQEAEKELEELGDKKAEEKEPLKAINPENDLKERMKEDEEMPEVEKKIDLDKYDREESDGAKDGEEEVNPKVEKKPTINRFFIISFFCFFMVLRSLIFILVIYTYAASATLDDFLYILAEVVYFNLLFLNVTNVFEVFKVSKYLRYNLQYFKNSFVDKVIYSNSLAGSQTFFDQINTLTDKEIAGYFDEELKTTKQEEQEEGDVPEGIARNIVRDAEQNTYYLNQLLLKIEKEVITISSFLSFLKLGIIAIKGYFLFAEFIIGLYSKDSPKQATRGTSIQTNDLLRNSVQTSLILIEILVIKYYVSSTSHHTDKEDEPKKLSKFVVMLIAKIEYYAKFSTVKLQEHITERKIKKQKDKAQKLDRGVQRGSSFFDLTNLQNLPSREREGNREVKNSFFLKKSDTWQDLKFRTEKIKVDIEEIWIKEKKTFFEELRAKRNSYFVSLMEYRKVSDYTFNETFDEYSFKDIKTIFLNKNINLEEDAESEDSSDLVSDKLTIKFVMGEGTPKTNKFILYHRNYHKYKFSMILMGISFFLRRLVLFPLLFVVATQPSLVNLPLLVFTIVYSLRGSKLIIEDLAVFMPLFSVIFLIMYFSNQIFQQTHIRAFMGNFKPQTIDTNGMVVQSTFIVVIALGLMILLGCVYFVATTLYVVDKKIKEIFFRFQMEHGIKVLKINFIEWNKSLYSKLTVVVGLLYDYLLDYYLVISYLVSIAKSSIYNTLLLMTIIFFITSQMVASLKKYSLKQMSSNILRNYTYIFNMVIFFLLINYNLSVVIARMTQGTNTSKLPSESLFSFLAVMILNFVISDFTSSKDYVEDKTTLTSKNELKMRCSALLESYNKNEEVIFERVKLISKLSQLDAIEKKYWANINSLKKLDFDFNYWHEEIQNHIQIKQAELTKRYFSGFDRFKMKLYESIYRFCHSRTTSIFMEDFLYILLQIFAKNKFLMRGGKVNIEDYYGGDFSKYEAVFSDISNFYHGLKNKETLPSNTYKNKYSEFLKKYTNRTKEKQPAEAIKKENTSQKEVEYEKKDEDDLRLGANLLFSILNQERKASDNSYLDSEVMICNFGSQRVEFFNLKNNITKRSRGLQKLSLRLIFRLITELLLSRLELIVSFLIIFIQIYKGGIENFFILGIIFFLILIETHHGSSKWWNLIFYIYLVKCTIVYIVHNFNKQFANGKISFDSHVLVFFSTIMEIFMGTPMYEFDAVCMLSVFILNQVLKLRGYSEKYLIEYEDPGSCIARVCINDKIENIFTGKQSQEVETFEEKCKFYEERLDKTKDSSRFGNYSSVILREKVSIQILCEKQETAFLKSFIVLVRQARNDLYEASFENVKSFWWRNFSFYTRKSGKDRSGLAFLFFLMAMLFVTYYIPKLGNKGGDIMTSIFNNEVISSNTLLIVIFVIFGIVEGVINRKNSNDNVGLVRTPMMFEKMAQMKIEFKTEALFMKPIEKLRKCFRKLKALFKLRNCIREKKDPISESPLLRKYKFMIVFWVTIHFIVYLYLVVISSPDLNKTKFQMIQSFFKDTQAREASAEWKIIRLFYFLCILYTYVNISQIHYGKEIFVSCVTPLTVTENVRHLVSNYTPFFREVGVLMDFLANKSSLQLRHKLTFNDVHYNIMTAKSEESTRTLNSFGKKPAVVMKYVIAFVWLILASIILFGPLLPFSSIFNKQEAVYIRDASMQVLFSDATGHSIGKLFETQTNIQTHLKEYTDPYYLEFNKYSSGQNEVFDQKLFEVLRMSKMSETRSTLEDKFFSELISASYQDIYNIIIEGSLRFRLNIQLTNDKQYSATYVLTFKNGKEKEADELTRLLLTKCDIINVKRSILIDSISLVLKVEKLDSKSKEIGMLSRPQMNLKTSSNYMMSKISINSECDANKRKIYSLFNEDVTKDHLNFLIITHETQNPQAIIEKAVGFEIEVFFLYIIAFRYLGASIIKDIFFEKQSMNWFTQIPDPDKILCLLDAIKYAQFEGDHMREELLFFYLIDIMRNPESLKEISGAVRDKQWEIYLKEQKQGAIKA